MRSLGTPIIWSDVWANVWAIVRASTGRAQDARLVAPVAIGAPIGLVGLVALLWCAWLAGVGGAQAQMPTVMPGQSAQSMNELPTDLVGVDIIERLDNSIPLDLPFIDDAGNEVTLGNYFDGTVPVILQIGYNRCPMLCNLVLNELVKGLKNVDLTSPDKFRLISISVDPTESHELASLKKRGYVMEYGRPEASRGWHFLTGPESSSRSVANAVGFGYRWVPETQEFAHAAVVILCTPDGRVSRYLYGVRYSGSDLRLGLLEASDGKIGTTLDRILLWCHVYDPDSRGYVLFAMRLMRLGGAVTLVLLAGGLALLWIRELRRSRAIPVPSPRSAA